ncbi:MAG: glutathione S-transferase family protein [Leptolyngbya sp. SIO3F4]|nr:glutathione S-transferase family protein [Leptolyngbya sp. SIO3F4]
MLTFYYHPLSPISRRVWLALLEKEILFKSIIVDLSKREQFQSDFVVLSPFHHIPVILEDGFRVIESLAILDYLEHQYPQLPLVPTDNREKTTMRMVQMVTVNELMPKISKLVNADNIPLSKDIEDQLSIALKFLNNSLGNQLYFGGDKLNLADIVVGATVPLFCRLGLEISSYPALNRWCNEITARSAWTRTNPNDEDFYAWRTLLQRWIKVAIKRQIRQHQHL